MFHVCPLRIIAVGSAVFALAVVAGCEVNIMSTDPRGAGGTGGSSASSSSSSSGSAGMGGEGGAGGSGGMGGSGGSLLACGMGTRASFAVDKLFFGDTDRDGMPQANAWKSFGFNIDGRISTAASTGLCKPAAGGMVADAYLDGNNGVDNSFGRNVVPILLGLAADVTTLNNESMVMGDHTYLLSIADADQNACATSSSFFLGGNLGQTPKFDGTDVWPIDAISLLDPTKTDSAKCMYSSTRIEGNVVQAGPPSQFDFIVNVSGFTMVLPVRKSRMAFTLEPGLGGIVEGQIGGVIRTEDLVQEMKRIAAAFDVIFCDPTSLILQSILIQVRQASDIMVDGTQDPTKECDGISIGLGFTMKPVTTGNVAPAPPPPPDPCVP